jgi:hypothetical protein
MRSSTHAPGSPAAQQSLQALAGWAPSRRGFIGSLLVAGAATTAAGTAAALAIPAAATAPAGVSGRMAGLIADFVRLNAALYDDTDYEADPLAWDRAAEARRPALEALVFERLASLIDFAAKMSTLAEFMAEEDSELFTLRRLAEDATHLAGVAK